MYITIVYYIIPILALISLALAVLILVHHPFVLSDAAVTIWSQPFLSNVVIVWGLIRCIISPCGSSEAAQKRLAPSPDAEAWVEERFAQFLNGVSEEVDADNVTPPPWLDAKKLARARELHLKYWPVITNAQVMSLFLSFTFFENTKPLIFTGQSDTADRARRRYLETALHVHTWELGDIWEPGDLAYRSADTVQSMHRAVGSILDDRQLAFITAPGQLPPRHRTCGQPQAQDSGGGVSAGSVSAGSVRKGAVSGGGSDAEVSACGAFCPTPVISQRGMAATQWFFTGLVVLHPEKFGLGHLSDYDLESFIHLWRSIGHRLGLDERNNLLSGSLEQTRALLRLVERRYLVSGVLEPQEDWDAMTHALYDGLGQVFSMCDHAVWRYYLLHDVLGLEAAKEYGYLSWRDLWRYRFLRALYRLGNQDQGLHGSIRVTAKRQLKRGTENDQLSKELMSVFDII